MDGVLLEPRGYYIALRTSVQRIGMALGAPQVQITEEQIARFEAAHVTNEWDTLAICSAIILVHLWRYEPTLRIDEIKPRTPVIPYESPDFDHFLDQLTDGGQLPGLAAYDTICAQTPWLDHSQKTHLKMILENCRNVYSSPTLPAYLETVLGSQLFHECYGLEPQFGIEGCLTQYDRPIITSRKHTELLEWLVRPNHYAGIMTNRPNQTPDGYVSPPEAELGLRLVDFESLPFIGSGTLAWFAIRHTQYPAHTYAKPHPAHFLSLIQFILGKELVDALQTAVDLCEGNGNPLDWQDLDGAQIIIFEDSTKGLLSGLESQKILQRLGFYVDLKLIGVSTNPIKLNALEPITTYNIANINHINWNTVFL
ncbi:MAG: hypothetical protein ACNA70_02455 [Brevefilum sp.]